MMILALDSGKTRTTAVAIDENLNVICRTEGKGGGLIYSNELIREALIDTITDCLRRANRGIDSINLIMISWADLDTEAFWAKAEAIVNQIANDLRLPRSRIVFDHDAVAAYYAVTLGEPGVAVIAGTGAIAFGMNRRGERARSSGWGWLIGDEGSAFWIAQRALNAASRAYDGRGPWTSLVTRLTEYFKVKNLLNILDVIYSEPPEVDKVADLARVVTEEAERGDEVSISILREAGRELASTVISIAERLSMVNDDIVVGGVGSVFNSRIVWETFSDEVKAKLTRAVIKGPLTGAYSILGPLVMGLRRMGINLTQREADELLKRLT